jgi:hypothetical protein
MNSSCGCKGRSEPWLPKWQSMRARPPFTGISPTTPIGRRHAQLAYFSALPHRDPCGPAFAKRLGAF